MIKIRNNNKLSNVYITGDVIVQSRGVTQVGKFLIDKHARTVMIGDKEVAFHKNIKGRNIVAAGNHLIIDGYKLMDDGTWQDVHSRKSIWSKFVSWLKRGN